MNVNSWYSLPFWGFCPPGTGEICRRPTDQREVTRRGVKTIEGRGEATIKSKIFTFWAGKKFSLGRNFKYPFLKNIMYFCKFVKCQASSLSFATVSFLFHI